MMGFGRKTNVSKDGPIGCSPGDPQAGPFLPDFSVNGQIAAQSTADQGQK